ncbi:MAG: LytTR family DNA-binding domain-containing protein [Burkholderiales bacterium]
MTAPAPLRVFLVDDEQPARARMREVLGDLAAELPNVVVGEAATGQEALGTLPAAAPDVVLVDIHMPQMSGMEFARHLAILDAPPAVVFVTAHDQYAIEAFEVNALDYLLKPVRAARLAGALAKARATGGVRREAVDRAAVQAGQVPRRFFSIGERGKILLVSVADVVYLKAELKYVTVRTADREHLLEEALTGLEQEFAGIFVRIHRSCLVARRRIRGFERVTDEDGEGAGWAVILDGVAEKLPVSRRQWPAVKALANG